MKYVIFLAGLMSLLPVYSFAGDFQSGNTVIIDVPQHKDLYISGGTVILNAPVYGDVIVAGGTVTINDSVMNDVLVAGGRVAINSYVGDDVRCAGGEVTVNSYIAGDLIGAGGKVFANKTTSAGSMVLSGGEVTIDGASRSTIKVMGGTIRFNGVATTNADLRGGTIYVNGHIGEKAVFAASSDIIVANSARIGRSTRYWLPLNKTLKLPAEVSADPPVYDSLLSITYSRWYFLGASSLLGLLWYLGMAYVLIVLLLYLFPRTLHRAGDQVINRPVVSGLWGLAYFVAVPLAIVVLLVSIIGVPVAALLAIMYVAVLLMVTIISAVVVTHWVENFSQRSWGLWHKSGIALFNFILLKILTFTPFLGAFLMMMISLIAVGSIVSSIRWRRSLVLVNRDASDLKLEKPDVGVHQQ
jgi:hypothetical protein